MMRMKTFVMIHFHLMNGGKAKLYSRPHAKLLPEQRVTDKTGAPVEWPGQTQCSTETQTLAAMPAQAVMRVTCTVVDMHKSECAPAQT
uniref:Alternative protein ERBB2 n=1 Tax=Homo sapiens TaxID=9606 RepID=L8E8G2_HUMAN|nr:alternative protein ERBB2 [Homo sapiens]